MSAVAAQFEKLVRERTTFPNSATTSDKILHALLKLQSSLFLIF